MKMEILTVQNQFVHMMPSTKVKGEFSFCIFFLGHFWVTYAFSTFRRLNRKKYNKYQPSLNRVPLKHDAIVRPFCTCNDFISSYSFQESQKTSAKCNRRPNSRLYLGILPFCTLGRDFLSLHDLQGDSFYSLYRESSRHFSERRKSPRKPNESCIKMQFSQAGKFSPIFSHSASAPPVDEVSSDEFAIFLHTFFASSIGAWQARVLTRFQALLTPGRGTDGWCN